MSGRRQVVVCDERGNAVGTGDVLGVHRGDGVLHKAFSILVFRRGGAEVLLQQRSARKPLFASRWANTCCSHPRPDDRLVEAAQRRLREEFGFTTDLREVGSFVYRARDSASEMTEYEHDTVLVGCSEGLAPHPDPEEIAAWQWIAVEELQLDLARRSERYAPWLAAALHLALEDRAASGTR